VSRERISKCGHESQGGSKPRLTLSWQASSKLLLCSSCSQFHVVDLVVSRRSVIPDFRTRSQTSPCEIYGRQSGTWTGGFFPISITAPILYTHLHFNTTHITKTSGRNLGIFKKTMSFCYRGALNRNITSHVRNSQVRIRTSSYAPSPSITSLCTLFTEHRNLAHFEQLRLPFRNTFFYF
jgi:hypothetical protein